MVPFKVVVFNSQNSRLTWPLEFWELNLTLEVYQAGKDGLK